MFGLLHKISMQVTECDSCQRTNHSIKVPHLSLQPIFSKWPEAAPLQNKEATTVAHFMYSFYCRFGASDIITDQGREFINEVTFD